ncbi:MAG: serine/threonine protein kinase [Acidobacteria bacterium]|nr:MAG: serine/threonine protein kinase [Acidobacteriota bacterium]REK09803.1 MAG: serine/threonine protein kinase [Acidobacteriota bacterium]
MYTGGNGILRSCFDGNLGRWVLLKTLPEKLAKQPKDRRRLMREARVTAQLQHPNTVPVYEMGLDHYGDVYFAMKRIEGENLFEIIRRIARGDEATRAEFNVERMLGTLIQASLALAYAHTHGVIHRDVKPENIIIGTYGEVYLMDWGVAKVRGMAAEGDSEEIDDAALFERLTITGKRPGTPLYMSPEQVAGEEVDERTDIFSMGVVLYEALAAREPFRGRDLEETFDNIRNAKPTPPSEIATQWQVDRELDAICFRALEKDPANRFQSMFEMIRAVRRFRASKVGGDLG